MHKAERVLAYGGIFASLALGTGFYFGSTQSTARATGELALSNGRIAAVDVFEATKKLLESDRYAPAREAMAKERNASLDGYNKDLTDLRTKIETAGQSSPEAAPMIAEYQAKAQGYQEAKAKAQEEFNGLLSAQFNEAYRLIVETANLVGKKLSFSYVVVTKTGPVVFESKDFNQAGQEVLSRPLIMFGEGDDITPAVLAELKLNVAPAANSAPDAKPVEEAKPEEKK